MTLNKVLGYALGPIGAALVGFVTLPLITWFYSVEDVGRISMLQVVASFCVLLFTFGLDRAYIREYHEFEDKQLLLKTVLVPSVLLCIALIITVLSYSVLAVSRWLYGMPSIYLSLITCLYIVLLLLSRYLSLILRMQERAIAYSMSQLFPKLFFLVIVVGTVLSTANTSFELLVLAYVVSAIVVFIVFSWSVKEELLPALSKKINWMQLKDLLAYSLPLVVAGFAAWGLNVADKLFLRSLSTFAELGIYSVAVSISSVAIVFSGIFNTIWSPMVYKWVKEGLDTNKIDGIAEHLLAALFFIVVFAGVFAWIIPLLLPEEYKSVEYLFLVCLLAPLLYTLSETTAIGMTIVRKTSYSMYASVIALFLNIIGNYLLIPIMGAVGAAVSTCLSFLAFFILRTELSKIVWRKIPTKKPYVIVFLISIAVISNALYFKGNVVMIAIWLALGLLGSFVFRDSVSLLVKELKKLAKFLLREVNRGVKRLE